MIQQAGCVPLRVENGRSQVLLITSRYTGEWILPKGTIESGETAEETARREAGEEAGVGGVIGAYLGTFDYPKGSVTARVATFVLEVTGDLPRWPEQTVRRRRWFDVEEARQALCRPEMRAILEAALTLRGDSALEGVEEL